MDRVIGTVQQLRYFILGGTRLTVIHEEEEMMLAPWFNCDLQYLHINPANILCHQSNIILCATGGTFVQWLSHLLISLGVQELSLKVCCGDGHVASVLVLEVRESLLYLVVHFIGRLLYYH